MPGPNGSTAFDSAQPISALLLGGEHISAEERNVASLLDFFAIPRRTVVARDGPVDECEGRYAIVGSADRILEAIEGAQNRDERLPAWIAKARTVYVHGYQDDARSTRLLRLLTREPQANLRSIQAAQTTMTVAADCPEMCGPMSGMQVPVTLRAPGYVCDIGRGVAPFQSIIRADEGELFFAVTYAGTRFFMNTWGSTVDISSLSTEYFDVKSFFGEAVPSVFYLKWAFHDPGSCRNETNACLIVDDPPLKRRYGFLSFREALDLMDRHNFDTTIGLIPWNWRRAHPRTVSLFRSRRERFSLVFHGCDHTAGEFAVQSPALLNWKIRTATQRMESFQRRTSVEVGRVMVFPQGKFSPETGRALKLNGFIAAVNTEVAPVQREANKTQIADLWSMAIMKYGTFPIFTRRYFAHGIENFAFDGLLGKPCLIAAHHDVFRDHGRNLVDFVGRLNSLQWTLVWRPLNEALRRSFTFRCLADGTSLIRMFAASLMVTNPEPQARRMLLLKEEDDPDCVQAVYVNQTPVNFRVEGGYLQVRLNVFPGEAVAVRVAYRDLSAPNAAEDPHEDKFKIAARRYLSEFRDNYLSRSDLLYRCAKWLKHLMR